MILFNCQVADTVLFTELIPFQGTLKKCLSADTQKLAKSLLEDGLITPFIIWHKPNTEFSTQPHYVIDGHQRMRAIQHIAQVHPEVLQQRYPVLVVTADDVETAKAHLLQISSRYGQITAKGLYDFMATAPNIKLDKCRVRVQLHPVSRNTTARVSYKNEEFSIMRIRVRKEDVQQLTDLLSDYNIEVL